MKNHTINFYGNRKPKIVKADYFEGSPGSPKEFFSFMVKLKTEKMDGSVSWKIERVFMISADVVESISISEA